jgi:hypothetical protein
VDGATADEDLGAEEGEEGVILHLQEEAEVTATFVLLLLQDQEHNQSFLTFLANLKIALLLLV